MSKMLYCKKNIYNFIIIFYIFRNRIKSFSNKTYVNCRNNSIFNTNIMINYISNNINNNINKTNSNNTLSNKNETNYFYYHNDNYKEALNQRNRVNIFEEHSKLINSKKTLNIKKTKEEISNQYTFDKDSKIEKTLSYNYYVKNLLNKKNNKTHNKKRDLINKIKKYSLNINMKSITNENGLNKKIEKNKTSKNFLKKNNKKANKEKDSKYIKYKKEIFDKIAKNMMAGVMEKSGKKTEMNIDIRKVKSDENKKNAKKNIKIKSTLENDNIIDKINEKIKKKSQTEIYEVNSNLIKNLDKNKKSITDINKINSNEKEKEKDKDINKDIHNKKKKKNIENGIKIKFDKERLKSIGIKMKETNVITNNKKEKEKIEFKEDSLNTNKNMNINSNINENKVDDEKIQNIEIVNRKEEEKKDETENKIINEDKKEDNNKENIINENEEIKEEEIAIEIKKEDNSYITHKNNDSNIESQSFNNEINDDDEKYENYYIDISKIKSDSQIPKEYINKIYRNLLMEEEKHISAMPIYKEIKSQKEINLQMRSILVDWIIDVHYKFSFTDETLFMTILIIDRYISIKQISRIKFQLLGITAMLLACKHEEINVPKVEDFIYITDNAYTKEEVIHMENDILNTLNFELLYPSPIKFYEILSLKFNFDKFQHLLGKYLMESFLIDLNWINYKPSVISCACIYIVMKYGKKENYQEAYNKKYYNLNESNFFFSKFNNEYDIKECAKSICSFVDNINKTCFLSCKKKYATKENEKVSLIVEGQD